MNEIQISIYDELFFFIFRLYRREGIATEYKPGIESIH